MHALEAIIARNARAAGREAAHAVNDESQSEHDADGRDFTQRCIAADLSHRESDVLPHDYFSDGWETGRRDG